MIRKPSSHFESVFNGYQIDTLLGMDNSSNPFDEFLGKPKEYLLQYLKTKPRFDINLNMAKNGNWYTFFIHTSVFPCWNSVVVKKLER